MTQLAQAARNFLAQQTSVTDLLGKDDLWTTWIFVDDPEVMIESTGQAMIVITADGSWGGANNHNTARFPQLIVDIWVDPTRNPDGSVFMKDAKIRADLIYKALDKFFHQMHNNVGGEPVYWGNSEEIAEKTGVRIISSLRVSEPSYRKAFDDQGAYMATVRYNVTTD